MNSKLNLTFLFTSMLGTNSSARQSIDVNLAFSFFSIHRLRVNVFLIGLNAMERNAAAAYRQTDR